MQSAVFLEEILKHKRETVHAQSSKYWKECEAKAKDMDACYGFLNNLLLSVEKKRYGVIAEIKRASPSKGIIRENYDPISIAKQYQQAEVSCISVLTDQHFFQGNNQHFINVRQTVTLPLLRKDFLLFPIQVAETRAIGADCILLIMAAVSDTQADDIVGTAHELGLEVLIEVHDRNELERAVRLRTPMIGINNRNLHTFETTIQTTIELLADIPSDRTVISESGIQTPEDLKTIMNHDVNIFLIGESFMRQDHPGEACKMLFQDI